MQPDRFTIKSQEALQAAQRLGDERRNPQTTPEHLLAVLLEQEGGVVAPVLRKLGAEPAAVRQALSPRLDALPTLTSGTAAPAEPGGGAPAGLYRPANARKPMLACGELRAVGATTLDEYRKHIEKDAALERRFQPVYVGEPSVEDTIAILRGLKERYQVHHKVRIQDSALVAAATLSQRY